MTQSATVCYINPNLEHMPSVGLGGCLLPRVADSRGEVINNYVITVPLVYLTRLNTTVNKTCHKTIYSGTAVSD